MHTYTYLYCFPEPASQLAKPMIITIEISMDSPANINAGMPLKNAAFKIEILRTEKGPESAILSQFLQLMAGAQRLKTAMFRPERISFTDIARNPSLAEAARAEATNARALQSQYVHCVYQRLTEKMIMTMNVQYSSDQCGHFPAVPL